MHKTLRHRADPVASGRRTVGTRGLAQSASGQRAGAPWCGRGATLRTLGDSKPDGVKSPNGRARDCGVLVTLSRNASNRQTAARKSVKAGKD
jgi:hypothetical protein